MNPHSFLREVTSLEGRRFLIVSNRQPFAHVRQDGADGEIVRVEKPPSGLTLALEPMLQATSGTWVASASGNADAEFTDAHGHVFPLPAGIQYSVRRVFLPAALSEDYYSGFANSSLWPLCHIAYRQPQFEERWWKAYVEANQRFADAVAEEVDGERAVIFIQDFHLALLPQMLRERCPRSLIAQFWHIPWPNAEAFRICPWRKELLRGLLGNDLLGFHLPYHCINFLESVDRELQVRVDRERDAVVASEHRTNVAAFPLGVDYSRIRSHAQRPATQHEAAALHARYAGNRKLVLSVERMDYTKGILERIEAIRRLFERHPRLKGQVVFIEIATPTRTSVEAYRDYAAQVEVAVARLNAEFGTPDWTPIVDLHLYVEPEKVWVWYHAADAVIVSSLHDGMNLVAKEFVAAGRDDAVLLLSEFAGAARELREAVPLNPFATDHFADAIAGAFELNLADRTERMRRMRWRVSNHDIGAWARDVLRAIRQHEFDAQNGAFAEPVSPMPRRSNARSGTAGPRARSANSGD